MTRWAVNGRWMGCTQTEVRETRFLSSAQVRHDREKDGNLYYDTDDDFIDDTVRPSV